MHQGYVGRGRFSLPVRNHACRNHYLSAAWAGLSADERVNARCTHFNHGATGPAGHAGQALERRTWRYPKTTAGCDMVFDVPHYHLQYTRLNCQVGGRCTTVFAAVVGMPPRRTSVLL
jgi:hypothetical protein